MNQIFTESEYVDGSTLRITGDKAHHIRDVLRMRAGEEIRAVCSDTGFTYVCRIDSMDTDEVKCTITDIQSESAELPVGITIYQGMPKSDKLEFVIQKSVEMGAVSVVPVMMKRSVVKLDESRVSKKLERWNLIARSAAEQSKRTVVPVVHRPVSFKEALERAAADDAILLPYEMSSVNMDMTRKLLTSLKEDKIGSVAVFIGPEGGFDPEEIESAADVGAHIITLGRRILRTETASVAILSWLTYIFEE